MGLRGPVPQRSRVGDFGSDAALFRGSLSHGVTALYLVAAVLLLGARGGVGLLRNQLPVYLGMMILMVVLSKVQPRARFLFMIFPVLVMPLAFLSNKSIVGLVHPGGLGFGSPQRYFGLQIPPAPRLLLWALPFVFFGLWGLVPWARKRGSEGSLLLDSAVSSFYLACLAMIVIPAGLVNADGFHVYEGTTGLPEKLYVFFTGFENLDALGPASPCLAVCWGAWWAMRKGRSLYHPLVFVLCCGQVFAALAHGGHPAGAVVLGVLVGYGGFVLALLWHRTRDNQNKIV